MSIFWLILMVICIVFEIATVGLVSIWFAGGALIACFLAMANIHVVIQVIVFLVVSLLLLIVTKPMAKEWINKDRVRTNYEGIIGKVVRVTERVDNINETGTALINGQEWTARSKNDNIILEQGEVAQVVNISGVKLILKKYQD
ncbi:MAG: NfeD family protein [Lachnospiraceae bacterium]|nr:NfeD family protein [Lachnospiraceae bacterium]MEE0686284.1 NfeD family protein [Lachnospiraceae bacterium]